MNADQSPPDFSNIVVTEASGLQSGGTITAPFTPVFTWSGVTDESGLLQYLYYFNQCDAPFPTFIGDTEGAAGNPSSPTVTLAPIQDGAYGCYELSLIAQDTVGNSSDVISVFRFTYDNPQPAQADIALIKTADQAQVPVGSNIVYTMTMTNLGPDGATGVTLTDPIPAGTTYVSNNGGCGEANGVITCNLGALAVGGTARRGPGCQYDQPRHGLRIRQRQSPTRPTRIRPTTPLPRPRPSPVVRQAAPILHLSKRRTKPRYRLGATSSTR